MQDAHDRYVGVDDGAVADYIPALADADPALFGHRLGRRAPPTASATPARVHDPERLQAVRVRAGLRGARHRRGARARRRQQHGPAVQLGHGDRADADSPINPLVNAGAIATTSLVAGRTAPTRSGRSCGGALGVRRPRRSSSTRTSSHSERRTNRRNQAIARLLDSYGRIAYDPTRRPTSTPGSARCSSPPTTSPSWARRWPTAASTRSPASAWSTRRCAATCSPALATAGLYERVGRLALRGRAARQERGQRRDRHRRPRQGRPQHVLPAAGRGRQQRPRPAGHALPLRGARA